MTVTRPREADTANSFWLVDDDLLRDASFQQLFNTVTTPGLTPYTLNYNAPQSCMQLLGWGAEVPETPATRPSTWRRCRTLC